MSKRSDFISKLEEINKLVKPHYKLFHYKYESGLTTIQQVKDRIKKKKKIGFTCLVPCRLALKAVGVKRKDGKSLIYAKNGSFGHCFSGNASKYLTRIKSGGAIGKTVKQAIDKGLLKKGDICAFKDKTHTFVYSGEGYKFYDGGHSAGNYSKGILVSYEKRKEKLSEILRWKTEQKKTETGKENDTMKQDKFINKVAPMAVKDAVKSDILASITIAQAILESGWGTTDLCKNGNALFGIKKHDWKGKTYTKKSYEYEHGKKVLRTSTFRAYNSWQESINDHSNYLKTRKVDGKNLTYKAVVGEKDYKKAAKALKKAGYSTYPDYADQLIRIIEQYHLTKYDDEVKKQKETNKETTPKEQAKAPAVETPKVEKKPSKKAKIFLDAGHGGKDSGAVFGKRKESNDVLKLVMAIGKKLEESGYSVGYSRKTDIYETPTKKAEDGNTFKADYFFSFHRNCANQKAHGYETLYYSKSEKKDAIRKDIKAKMKAIGFTGRDDTKRTDLAVLKKTKAPALLFEVGFIDSISDNLIFDENFDAIVNAFVEVITKHCN